MPGLRSGFGNLRQQQARQDALFKGQWIPYLRLKDDGDIAKFRIVSEYEEDKAAERGMHSTLISGNFHRVEKRGGSGKVIFQNVLCALDEGADGELTGECQHCEEEIRRPVQFMVWVWVYGIYHRTQSSNPKVQWRRGKLGAQKVYLETVDKFMVWQDGYFMTQALEDRISRYGSLTDRDYRVTRHGVRGTTKVIRELEALDPSEMDPEILEESASLPSLDGIATGAITTMDGSETERPDDGKTYDEIELPTFDDDEGGEGFKDDDFKGEDNGPATAADSDDLDALPF